MTAPIRDLLRLGGENWLVEFGPYRDAITERFEITPTGSSTACGVGWFADLALVDDELVLEALHLYGGRATVASTGRAVTAGDSPLAVPAFLGAGHDVSLPLPQAGPGQGLVSYVGIGASLPCSGPLVVGRSVNGGGRQAMALVDRQRLELDHGRLRR